MLLISIIQTNKKVYYVFYKKNLFIVVRWLLIIIIIILIKCSCMFVHTLHSPKNKTLHVSDSLGNMIHFIIVIIFLTFHKNFVCDVRKQTI